MHQQPPVSARARLPLVRVERPQALEQRSRMVRAHVRDHVLAIRPDPVPQEIRGLVRVRRVASRIIRVRSERPNLVTLRRRERIDRLLVIERHPALRVGQAVVEVPPLRLAELEHHRQARRRDLVGALLVHLLEVVPDARAEVHLVRGHVEEHVLAGSDHAARVATGTWRASRREDYRPPSRTRTTPGCPPPRTGWRDRESTSARPPS